jgi:hypothetical protein
LTSCVLGSLFFRKGWFGWPGWVVPVKVYMSEKCQKLLFLEAVFRLFPNSHPTNARRQVSRIMESNRLENCCFPSRHSFGDDGKAPERTVMQGMSLGDID